MAKYASCPKFNSISRSLKIGWALAYMHGRSCHRAPATIFLTYHTHTFSPRTCFFISASLYQPLHRQPSPRGPAASYITLTYLYILPPHIAPSTYILRSILQRAAFVLPENEVYFDISEDKDDELSALRKEPRLPP